MNILNDWKLIILLCLTLGMAPFVPEPHLFGKVKWVMGGAVGMAPMDWFDLLLHGFPFLLLIRFGIVKGIALYKSSLKPPASPSK